MAVAEIAQGIVDLSRAGKSEEAVTRYYAEDILSVEPMGDAPEAKGIAAVLAKHKWWNENFEVHSAEATGPFLHGSQFAVIYKMDITHRASGKRSNIEEVGIYTVQGDKIVEERFFYNAE